MWETLPPLPAQIGGSPVLALTEKSQDRILPTLPGVVARGAEYHTVGSDGCEVKRGDSM